MTEAPEEPKPLDLRLLGIRVAVGLAALFLISWGLTLTCGDALEAIGARFVAAYGAPGVGIAVLVLDTSPVPMITEPVFLLALSGGLDPLAVGVAASLGSLAAAACGYALGWSIGRPVLLRVLSEDRRDQGRHLVSRYGFWGIALAALTPLPFAICTWSAGALRMRLLPFALGSLFRVPKVIFYVWMIQVAWRAAR